MFKRSLIAIAVTFWSIWGWSAETRTALDRFFADDNFCAYMVSYPDKESDEFMTRFQTALDLAVAVLRGKSPEMTYAQALLIVRSGCNAALNRP